MSDVVKKALEALTEAAESGKMDNEDLFNIGVIAGKHQKESEKPEEKKTA